jgi:hypothetical protein
MAWALFNILNGREVVIDTETPCAEGGFGLTLMECCSGKGDGGAGHQPPHALCPQKMCMACG